MPAINGYRATCGKCENRDRNGFCDAVSEFARSHGYPGFEAKMYENADASKCPDFAWDMDAVIEEEADSIMDDAVRALERAKGFAPHPKPREAA